MNKIKLLSLLIVVTALLVAQYFIVKKYESDQFYKNITELYKPSEWENSPDWTLSFSENEFCKYVIMDYYLDLHQATYCNKDDDCTMLNRKEIGVLREN